MVTKFRGATVSEELNMAVRIAVETGSIRTASSQSGISRKKISRAMAARETQILTPQGVKSIIKLKDADPTVKAIAKQAIIMGIDKASDELKDKIISLLTKLYDTAEEALDKTRVILKAAGDKGSDDWKVAQLKYLVSVWGTAIESGQLLSGKAVKEDGNSVTNNYTDARQIILTRIDNVTASRIKKTGG